MSALRLRAAITIITVCAAVVCERTGPLYAVWLLLLIIMIAGGIGALHARITLNFIVPLAAGATLIHGIAHFHDQTATLWQHFSGVVPKAILIEGRLGVIAAVTQWCIVPLTMNGGFIPFLRSMKLPARGSLILGATVTLLAEVHTRTRQIIESRLAEGHGTSGRRRALLQLPLVLMPLTVNLLDTAAARADLWRSRNLVTRLEAYNPPQPNKTDWKILVGFLLSLMWLFLAAVGRGYS